MVRVLLVDYYGTCNKEGEPVGHSSKVLAEYSNLLKEKCKVGAAVSPCLIPKEIEKYNEIISLKYNICTEDAKSIAGRIRDKFKLFYNIRQAFKIKGYDVLWFYRTDFFLYLFLYLFYRKEKEYKLIVQVYQDEFGKGWLGSLLKKIFMAGVSKADGIIYTRQGMQFPHRNTFYMPDYYYSEEKYAKYLGVKKQYKVVCLGAMNPYKKLEELVEVFNVNGICLEIKGFFYDKKRYEELCKVKKDNITIENRILGEEEYYSIMAEAQYSILPYDIQQYSGRTSGVLQESIFLGCIPIAPYQLLKENGSAGIGYEELRDLAERDFFRQEAALDVSAFRAAHDEKKIRKELYSFCINVKNGV
ncbi:MAG: hypothetical protein NC429_03305 [Lachnospiraceae bacterium]|nr:hypothetical protein [Lachnospiraceae bacterium]